MALSQRYGHNVHVRRLFEEAPSRFASRNCDSASSRPNDWRWCLQALSGGPSPTTGRVLWWLWDRTGVGKGSARPPGRCLVLRLLFFSLLRAMCESSSPDNGSVGPLSSLRYTGAYLSPGRRRPVQPTSECERVRCAACVAVWSETAPFGLSGAVDAVGRRNKCHQTPSEASCDVVRTVS